MIAHSIRPTRAVDVDHVVSWEHAPENMPFVTQWSREQHLAALDDTNVAHRFFEGRDGAPLGYMILAGLVRPHRSIELARIVVAAKGQGLGRAALRWAKSFAFGELSAHRLWLDVFPHNQCARQLYESEGFRVEGTLRECVLHEGQFRSLLVLSMLEQEWRDGAGG